VGSASSVLRNLLALKRINPPYMTTQSPKPGALNVFNVVLLKHTPQPEETVAMAAKLCYSPLGIEELKEKNSTSDIEKFLNKIMAMGHTSVLEHAVFTFGIEGISRVTSHQLVRHRIASYSQQSQRYVQEKGQFEYIVPPTVADNEKAKAAFDNMMRECQRLYDDW